MDPNIALRLDMRRGNDSYDAQFANAISTTAKQYIEAGLRSLNWAIADFDAATDISDMLQPVDAVVGAGGNFANIDRNAALCFRHPASFTQLLVMCTFLSQILFGGEQARSVEAQGEDDADKADDVNALLAWNDAKLSIYTQGFLWIWNAVVYNRGVWYEDSAEDVRVVREPIEEDDLSKPKVPLMKKDGSGPVMRAGKPVMVYQKRQRMRNKRERSGFFNTVHLVSPYDFICDPALPWSRFQELRYAGHRVMIPWHELKRRSELEPEDDQYVLPHVVLKVKATGTSAITPNPVGGPSGLNGTRTFWERTMRGGGVYGAGGSLGGIGVGGAAGVDGVNKDDGGTIECFVLYIRAKPKTLKMYDDNEFEVIQLLVSAAGDVFSCNVQRNTHDQFPYAVAESCPNGHRQFSPGWGLKCKPVQDRIDDLNMTHTTAMKRMGNILGADATKCDLSNILTPDKNGLIITKTKEGLGVPWDDILYQIPLTDTTASYNEEMAMWEKTLEDMTGSNSYVQGQTEDPSQTLGQFDATRAMATGRISSIARVIAEMGIMPQTKRFVENFQQFSPPEQMIRIMGENREYDPENPSPKYKVIKKTEIQGQFDVSPNDGSLPGTDSKVVAAAARAIEAYSGNPALAPAFDTKIAGSIDPIKLLRDLFKKSGLPIQKYAVSKEEAQKNTQDAINAQAQANAAIAGGGIPAQVDPNQGASPAPPPLPPITPDPNGGIPSASELPPTPSAAPPQLNGQAT